MRMVGRMTCKGRCLRVGRLRTSLRNSIEQTLCKYSSISLLLSIDDGGGGGGGGAKTVDAAAEVEAAPPSSSKPLLSVFDVDDDVNDDVGAKTIRTDKPFSRIVVPIFFLSLQRFHNDNMFFSVGMNVVVVDDDADDVDD